jgi:hypothetical protein
MFTSYSGIFANFLVGHKDWVMISIVDLSFGVAALIDHDAMQM